MPALVAIAGPASTANRDSVLVSATVAGGGGGGGGGGCGGVITTATRRAATSSKLARTSSTARIATVAAARRWARAAPGADQWLCGRQIGDVDLDARARRTEADGRDGARIARQLLELASSGRCREDNVEAERGELGLDAGDHAVQLVGRIRDVRHEHSFGPCVSCDRNEHDASRRAARPPRHGGNTLCASFACGPLGYVSR